MREVACLKLGISVRSTHQTLVYVDLTGGSSVAGVGTVAGEHVDSVFARAFILARTTFAVVNVHL